MPIFILSAVVYLVYLLLLPTAHSSMFSDPDTLWHLSAGSQIRELGWVPAHDTWSFTAGSHPWYNLSWLWDILASALYDHYHWHGVVMLNAFTIAATLSFMFALCVLATREGLSAFFATVIFSMTVCSMNLRPFQASMLFTAMTLLFLRQLYHGNIRHRWLIAAPMFMCLWANVHGAFITAFVFLGAYGLGALLKRDITLFRRLFATGVASLLACLINPYGTGIITGIYGTLASDLSQKLIVEWQPVLITWNNGPLISYLAILLFLTVKHPPTSTVEHWLVALWLIPGVRSVRNLYIFGLIAAPILAEGIHACMRRNPSANAPRPVSVERLCALGTRLLHDTRVAVALLLLCIATTFAALSPQAAHFYETYRFNPLPDLAPEVRYLESHYPDARLFNTFNLGGALIFMSHGHIKIWMDGRIDTAYPVNVARDYLIFHDNAPGWDNILNSYQMNAAIIPNGETVFISQFTHRKGWKQMYQGNTATIFVRQ